MHARPRRTSRPLRATLAAALGLWACGSPAPIRADDPPAAQRSRPGPAPKGDRPPRPPAPAAAGALPPLPEGVAGAPARTSALTSAPASPAATEAPATPATQPPPIAPGNAAECKRAEMGIGSRRDTLGKSSDKDSPAVRLVLDVLVQRERLLKEWRAESEKRDAAEHPEPNPEQVAAKARDDLKEAHTLLDGLEKDLNSLLPEAFREPAVGPAKSAEARLAEMKETLDATRQEAQSRAGDPDKAAAEAGKPGLPPAADLAKLRADRDKSQQALSALAAARAGREAASAAATAPEARELARERYTNFEWEYRVEAERLAVAEARLHLAKGVDEARALVTQAREARREYDRKLLEQMERRYATQSERQQRALEQAVASEQARAARTADVLERYRAKRSAELLELQAQAVAYETALAMGHDGPLSPGHQNHLADETVDYFEGLKKLLSDGTVSPLDLLRLKTAYRRIGPLRAGIVREDLAKIRAELTGYENALSDAEINLINDARDDRYDREALLDKLPEARHAAAVAVLDAMEARHHELLTRQRGVLQKLAERAEETQGQIHRRVRTLDEEYVFIRTHIFWVRDAEPVGPKTLGHARVEAARTLRALGKIACEPADREQWGRLSPDFVAAAVGLIVLPWPLRLGQRALDRRRLARRPTPAA